MPDYKDKLRQYQQKQGYTPQRDNGFRRENEGGNGGRDNSYRRQSEGGFHTEQPVQRLPDNYLKEGYLEKTEKGNWVIRKELLIEHADAIGRTFAEGRKSDVLKYSQLRKFYDHAVNCEKKLKLCDDFEIVMGDILKLNGFADYARSRKNIPEVFRTFIHKNVANIHTADDFRKGFLEHFQAVVASFRYYRPDND